MVAPRFCALPSPLPLSRWEGVLNPSVGLGCGKVFHFVRDSYIMVDRCRRADLARREKLHRFYLRHTDYINNWDLVDSSAEYLVRPFIVGRSCALLRRLIRSPNLWERRIAVLATFHCIKQGRAGETLWVARRLLRDP